LLLPLFAVFIILITFMKLYEYSVQKVVLLLLLFAVFYILISVT